MIPQTKARSSLEKPWEQLLFVKSSLAKKVSKRRHQSLAQSTLSYTQHHYHPSAKPKLCDVNQNIVCQSKEGNFYVPNWVGAFSPLQLPVLVTKLGSQDSPFPFSVSEHCCIAAPSLREVSMQPAACSVPTESGGTGLPSSWRNHVSLLTWTVTGSFPFFLISWFSWQRICTITFHKMGL